MTAATLERFTIPKPDIGTPAGRAEWLTARLDYFNASAAACLYDRHPFMTPADYAVEKITRNIDEAWTDHTKRGHHLEDGIARWVADDMGWNLIEPAEMFGAGPMLATLDRIVMQTGIPVEIKCPSQRHDDPAPYWLDQCQAQMICADAPMIHLVWLDSSMMWQHVEVDADPALQADMLDRAERFMAAVEFGIVPDWVRPQLGAEHVIALHPDPAGEIELSPDEMQKALRYDELRSEKSRIEDEMKALRDDLALVLGEAEAGLFGGAKIVTFAGRKGRAGFATDRFKKDHPDLFAEYATVGKPTRALNVTVPD